MHLHNSYQCSPIWQKMTMIFLHRYSGPRCPFSCGRGWSLQLAGENFVRSLQQTVILILIWQWCGKKQVQLRGVKTWWLRSPPECWHSCHGVIETTVYPGDIIVLNTNIWFHSTKVLSLECMYAWMELMNDTGCWYLISVLTQVHGQELSISMVNEFD